MKNKAFGFYSAGLTLLLGIVTIVIVLIYRSKGGTVNMLALGALIAAAVCEAALLTGEHAWSDYVGILPSALLAYAMMTILSDGIWNIAEAVNGIQMVGMPELAGLNITMAVVNFIAIVGAVVTSFAVKSK